MRIILTNHTTLEALKKQFSFYFPNLKLEFYNLPHKNKEGSEESDLLLEELTLAELGVKVDHGAFSFEPFTTVAAFEQGLQNGYSLPVQVFRKAGGVWLQTVQSDGLTLREEDRKGEASLQVESFNRENQLL